MLSFLFQINQKLEKKSGSSSSSRRNNASPAAVAAAVAAATAASSASASHGHTGVYPGMAGQSGGGTSAVMYPGFYYGQAFSDGALGAQQFYHRGDPRAGPGQVGCVYVRVCVFRLLTASMYRLLTASMYRLLTASMYRLPRLCCFNTFFLLLRSTL